MEPLAPPTILEVLVSLTWLLKDLGWVLLCGLVSVPAALASICLLSTGLWIKWSSLSTADCVHRVAMLLWLVGNACWMSSEFAFEPVGRFDVRFPWYVGPWAHVGSSREDYLYGVFISQMIFASGLFVLGAFYLVACASPRDNSSVCLQESPEGSQRDPVWGPLGLCLTAEVYELVFIAPWLLKDLFWTLEQLWPAVLCGFVVFMLMMDYFRRYGGELRLGEALWVAGNTTWIIAEIADNNRNHFPRLLAAAFIAMGVILAGMAVRRAITAKPGQWLGASKENSRLLGPNCRTGLVRAQREQYVI